MRRLLGVVLASGITVIVVDLALHSSLSHFLWPVVITPADGAIVSPPVVVRWEGAQPLLATLSRGGRRVELGLRDNPFEIEASSLPKRGQYSIRLRSPHFGAYVQVERRFFVREEIVERPGPTPHPTRQEQPQKGDSLTGLRQELDSADASNSSLRTENEQLRLQNLDLAATIEDLRELQEQAENRLVIVETQQAELFQEHLGALEENQLLRVRLQSLPACTIWGYLSYPRPQTSIPTRRIVVSNGRAEIFRNEADCHSARGADPTAASLCVCVGSVWN